MANDGLQGARIATISNLPIEQQKLLQNRRLNNQNLFFFTQPVSFGVKRHGSPPSLGGSTPESKQFDSWKTTGAEVTPLGLSQYHTARWREVIVTLLLG